MNLSNLSPHPGSRKPKKRLGRGPGSGRGKTAGRGHKGYKARSGSGVKPGFEGGQMPLQRRIPKRGFRNPFRKQFTVVNVKELNRFAAGSVIDKVALQAAGLISSSDKAVKVLATGELAVALTVSVDQVSEAARGKIEAAGGSVQAAA
ncbi:MAG: 50S ribosomal protein L15 [Desulfurivibrio sp.]|nr:50S ribosomal protein L15 [Desulfurivibrio sp.]